jgi:hypothetical protein
MRRVLGLFGLAAGCAWICRGLKAKAEAKTAPVTLVPRRSLVDIATFITQQSVVQAKTQQWPCRSVSTVKSGDNRRTEAMAEWLLEQSVAPKWWQFWRTSSTTQEDSNDTPETAMNMAAMLVDRGYFSVINGRDRHSIALTMINVLRNTNAKYSPTERAKAVHRAAYWAKNTTDDNGFVNRAQDHWEKLAETTSKEVTSSSVVLTAAELAPAICAEAIVLGFPCHSPRGAFMVSLLQLSSQGQYGSDQDRARAISFILDHDNPDKSDRLRSAIVEPSTASTAIAQST